MIVRIEGYDSRQVTENERRRGLLGFVLLVDGVTGGAGSSRIASLGSEILLNGVK